jgi:hypothetical protein
MQILSLLKSNYPSLSPEKANNPQVMPTSDLNEAAGHC